MHIIQHKSTHSGFSLIELIIVMAIIGILATIAYPSYQTYLIRVRRLDGIGALLNLAALMEQYYTEHNTYAGVTPTEIGGSCLSVEGHYTLSISSTPTSFMLSATPIKGDLQTHDKACSPLTLTHLGVKGPSVSVCW